ncbi:MAG: SUF system Fe-S cluster assembly protein [Alphaproteobacteria bacterium]|nr:SUF system Fe-S cluster assembly protein [Alphaproteobacteria bacterium]
MQTIEPTADQAGASDVAQGNPAAIGALVIETIKTIFDPEIPVNIYELGLIYNLAVGRDGKVDVDMTLTTPACPVAGSLPGEVEAKIRGVEGVADVTVNLVWEPPWSPDRMSEAAKLELGFL